MSEEETKGERREAGRRKRRKMRVLAAGGREAGAWRRESARVGGERGETLVG